MPDIDELVDTFDMLGAEGDSCIECCSGNVSQQIALELGGLTVFGLLCMEHRN